MRASRKTPSFRIFVDEAGKVFLAFQPATDIRVEVDRPVDRKRLDLAKDRIWTILAERVQLAAPEELARIAAREKAQKEVEAALDPMLAPGLLTRAGYVVQMIFGGLFVTWGVLFVAAIPFQGLQRARRSLPDLLYLVVLALYFVALILGVFLLLTARSRGERSEKIREWFGPSGLLIFPGLILALAVAFAASFTLALHDRKLVQLEPCRGIQVSQESLGDFYLWQFLEIVPLLKINGVLKRQEPICYSQARVGLLILLFQGLVVIPSITAVRFYWKNRRRLVKNVYAYDPDWLPNR